MLTVRGGERTFDKNGMRIECMLMVNISVAHILYLKPEATKVLKKRHLAL